MGKLLLEHEPWLLKGACRGHKKPGLWFPERGESTKEAKRLCGECPVKQDCLEYAIRGGIHFGIWGGMTEKERLRYRRNQAAAARKRKLENQYVFIPR
jgi:WhiB family redox-sensing transcriptional regulator